VTLFSAIIFRFI